MAALGAHSPYHHASRGVAAMLAWWGVCLPPACLRARLRSPQVLASGARLRCAAGCERPGRGTVRAAGIAAAARGMRIGELVRAETGRPGKAAPRYGKAGAPVDRSPQPYRTHPGAAGTQRRGQVRHPQVRRPPVQRLVAGGHPHHPGPAPDPGHRGPGPGRRPFDLGDGRACRGERTPPGAHVPRRGGHDARPIRGADPAGGGQPAAGHQR
jgi:hypothetical protein